jgi:hypothetical protein
MVAGFPDEIMPRREEPTVVNLRLVRKRKARADKDMAAAQNRAMHGRTKAEKTRDRLEAEKTAALLDAHLRQPRLPGDSG